MTTRTRNQEKQRLRAERTAAALKEKQRRERRRQLLTLVGVVVAIAVIITGGFVINSMRDTKVNAAAIPSTGSHFGVTIGPSSAPHKVVIYEDFLCPYCGELEKATHEKLAQLADAGKVQVEYRPIVFLSRAGPYSARATLIWWLVDQKYGHAAGKEFHDLLFAHQPSEQGPFPTREDLFQLAAQAGADPVKLQTALDDSEGVNEVADATKAAQQLGVKATPTILLDGKQFTNGRTVDDLATNLLDALQ
jgi:protein-disulfide isomerase